jgi:hypothetical protein
MNCRDCGRACGVSGYPTVGARGVYCRGCASRRSGLTRKILTNAKRAHSVAKRKNNTIARLRLEIAKYEEREALLNAEIDRLVDGICEMLEDQKTLEREISRHERKKRNTG